MERIELFDSYINNQLSDAQRLEFDNQLKSDEDFASDFKVYLMTVNGICREAHQNDMDFGVAIKNITKEQLREIIGPRNEAEKAASSQTTETVKPKVLRFKPWMWQVASIAAVIIIAFTAVYRIEQNSRLAVDNAIYACADINIDLARSSGGTINVYSLSDEELKEAIPTLTNLYQNAKSIDEVASYGNVLAVSYIRLHERDKAAEVLNDIIDKCQDESFYAEDVAKWKSILNLIK